MTHGPTHTAPGRQALNYCHFHRVPCNFSTRTKTMKTLVLFFISFFNRSRLESVLYSDKYGALTVRDGSQLQLRMLISQADQASFLMYSDRPPVEADEVHSVLREQRLMTSSPNEYFIWLRGAKGHFSGSTLMGMAPAFINLTGAGATAKCIHLSGPMARCHPPHMNI